MSRYAVVLSLSLLLAAVAAATAQAPSPYAGQEGRPIKALSETEMRDLAQGRGMGLAKAAELNSLPRTPARSRDGGSAWTVGGTTRGERGAGRADA